MKRYVLLLLPLFGSWVATAQLTVVEKGAMPALAQESSGLIFLGNKLVTHNDSGNAPQLMEIDTTSLQITRTVTILNAENIDWEDIAQDNQYIYIGDIGNNNGNRRDLKIYKVSKSDFALQDGLQAEEIRFSYSDQVDFVAAPNASDWDAEALFVLGDQLVVLTKQWNGQDTVAYSLPKDPGTHVASRVGELAVGGLVTGASYNEATEMLYIIGYSQALIPFVHRVGDVRSDNVFGGNNEKLSLGLAFLQAEGITEVGPNKYFISSETFNSTSPPISSEGRLFSFDTTDSPVDGETPDEGNGDILLYRSLGSRELNYQLEGEIEAMAIFNGSGQRIQYKKAAQLEGNTIDLSPLRPAIYYLTFYLSDKMVSEPFYVN
ncbi:MAG: T9SS C-terminal target domain-containing protein [Sediminicola sp.]